MEQVVESKRGKRKFVDDGYEYVFDRTSVDGTVQFWRCERRGRCKARIHVNDGQVIKKINPHSHGANAAKVLVDVHVTAIKERAQNTMELTSQLINNCLENANQACLGALPSTSALRKVVRRKRNAISNAPPNPVSVEALVIPPEYYEYVIAEGERENFLLFDSGPHEDRILIFGRQSNTQTFADCTTLFVDGTFKICPNLFRQVYTVSGLKHGGVHPIIYALLPNKRKVTYDRLFQQLCVLMPNLRPQNIYCDFEMAAFQSIAEKFPDSEICGCFFHLAQNLKKHIATSGLQPLYNNDASFALQARMITSMAFVPIEDIEEALADLGNFLPEELQPILDYFEDNYIGRRNRRGAGRRQPMFPVRRWNVYNRTLQGEDRTNNHAEAAHRRLQAELGMTNPVIWNFIDCLKKVQHGRDLYYEQLVAGRNPQVKLRKYRDADERIARIARAYNERGTIEFLRGIAHNFEMDD